MSWIERNGWGLFGGCDSERATTTAAPRARIRCSALLLSSFAYIVVSLLVREVDVMRTQFSLSPNHNLHYEKVPLA